MKKSASFVMLLVPFTGVVHIPESLSSEQSRELKPRAPKLFFWFMLILLLVGINSSASAFNFNFLFGKVTPKVELAEETVALLNAAGRNHVALAVTAVVDDGTAVSGAVDADYAIRFATFPWFWQTAEIRVALTEGPVFAKGLAERLHPKVRLDAVSTAALILGKDSRLKGLLYEERLREAVTRTSRGQVSSDAIRLTKAAIMTALVTRNIIAGTLTEDIDSYLDPDAESVDLRLGIPDYETSVRVAIDGHEFAPNEYGIATSQAGVLPHGASPFLANCPMLPGMPAEVPFHGRLRERAEHKHTDVFVDLDTGLSRIVPENTLPEGSDWDLCIKHLRDGWPYMRLNYAAGVAGVDFGPMGWDDLKKVRRGDLRHGPDHPGLLIIAHGEGAVEWNLAVKLAVDRIKARHPEYADWPMELAFLEDEMIEEDTRNAELDLTGRSIAEALEKLRGQGVAWVGVIPLMVNNCSGHIEEIRWILGQSVASLTSEWQGSLTTGGDANPAFGGFLAARDGTLSGEFAVTGFDGDVPEMEGEVGGTLNADGALTITGELEGYSADESVLCTLTLTSDNAQQLGDDQVVGDYTGTWTKQQKSGSAWVDVDGGEISGSFTLTRSDEGRVELAGLEVFLGSAIESHPLMKEIIEARVAELLADGEAETMGLTLGMHGADLDCCEEAWYEMGDAILQSVSAAMPFADAQSAFMREMGETVQSSVSAQGAGNALLTLHMIAPGSLSRSLPYVIGWPTLRPGTGYRYNQKTLLAYANQEALNLATPPFSLFPTMTAAQLGELTLDETSDRFVDWMALHAYELVSSYPIGDGWHGEKGADKNLEMTGNLYVVRTNQGRYVKLRVFTAGNGMVSFEYADTVRNSPIFR